MIESIQLLQRTVEVAGQNAMPAWPDILSKYTILLSQSHSLSMSLAYPISTAAARANGTGSAPPPNPYERLALHPMTSMTDAQLDNELIPVLRNQQTTDVLRIENETVRHLADHMATRGSLGVLAPTGPPTGPIRRDFGAAKKPEYEDVLAECEQIKMEHDERVDRAVRAVMLLREKYDWRARVEVDQEEPEELEWDPRMGASPVGGDGMNEGEEGEPDSEPTPDDQSNSSEEEEELEEVLGNGSDHTHTPGGTPPPQGSGWNSTEEQPLETAMPE